MTADTAPGRTASGRTTGNRRRTRQIVVGVVVLAVVVAMALSVKVVGKGSDIGAGPAAFSASSWGKEHFPKVQKAIAKRAVAASTLAPAVLADPTAAGKQYGVDAGTGPEISTTFTGTVGKAQDGIYPVTVAGLPSDLLIRIQTGPAINGTDLRDATGTVKFGQFTNQIDYQNAASALNDQLKKQVLARVDASSLEGKTVTVTGAFQLINPKGWLVTPSDLEVG
jgi:predicted lipoprotein